MSTGQVPTASKNFTNEHGLSEHGINYKEENSQHCYTLPVYQNCWPRLIESGMEFNGTPASSGETSQTTGSKVKDPSAIVQEGTGEIKGSLAEESESFGK